MNSQWLKAQFKLNPDKTKAGLAKAMKLEPPAISKILKETRQVKAHEYIEMRRYFGLPIDGEKSIIQNGDGYVISPLSSHDGFKDQKSYNSEAGSEWVIPADILGQRTKAPPEKVKIFQIQENTMEPDFRHGEHVVVDLSDIEPSPPGVFIVSDGFGYLIRQCEYLPQSKPPEIKVSAKDSSFLPQILKKYEFKMVGRVIAKIQWV
ncbi:MAG: hypothetical protein KAJ86_06505 [Alphaproteobacteria bacterium]|nr:hypothetical protein [Alphaproteobacteria bacterium]